MDFDVLAPQAPLPADPPIQFENVQLGFVETFTPPMDPSLYLNKAYSSPNPDALRMWAKFFNNVDQSLPIVSIPTQWMNFFTLLLMKQATFEWAKDFLQSSAWATVAKNFSGNGTPFSFSLPKVKPNVSIVDLSCDDSEVMIDAGPTGFDLPDPTHLPGSANVQDAEPVEKDPSVLPSRVSEATPNALQTPPPSAPPVTAPTPRGKRGKSLIICEATLRRSDRLHGISKGFKTPVCKERCCLGCDSNPPLLSASVVREPGTSFCNINAEHLTEEKLTSKPTKKGAIGKPKAKKPKQSEEELDAGAKPKKSRK